MREPHNNEMEPTGACDAEVRATANAPAQAKEVMFVCGRHDTRGSFRGR